jgi:hypothetical protein
MAENEYEPLLYPERANQLAMLSALAITALIPIALAVSRLHHSWINAQLTALLWLTLILLCTGIAFVFRSQKESQNYHYWDQQLERGKLDRNELENALRHQQKYDSVAWIHEFQGTELCESGLVFTFAILAVLPLVLIV